MIKKAALKATVGTAAASLLFLPGATMVASPSIELMACNYPDSRATVTQQSIEKPLVRKGQRNRSFVQVTADRGVPNGRVVLKFAKENRRGVYKAKPRLLRSKRVNDFGSRALQHLGAEQGSVEGAGQLQRQVPLPQLLGHRLRDRYEEASLITTPPA